MEQYPPSILSLYEHLFCGKMRNKIYVKRLNSHADIFCIEVLDDSENSYSFRLLMHADAILNYPVFLLSAGNE